MSTLPPCVGLHDLFDATDAWNHAKAAALCATCPLIDACAERVAEVTATAGYYGHPEGTWAGRLHLNDGSETRRLAQHARAERIAAEDAAYTETTARQAHSAYSMGDKSEWARTGHRVYDRMRKRRVREQQAIGAAS